MSRFRPYVVCRKCKESWLYADRISTHPCCAVCGATWPRQAKPKVRFVQSGDEASETSFRPPRQSKERKPGKAALALHTVWEKLTPEARLAIEEAGWRPPSAPRQRLFRLRASEACEAKQKLWSEATEQQKELTLKAGLKPPEQTPAPTSYEVGTAANAAFRKATVALKLLGDKKISLQKRIDHAKEQYHARLTDMKQLQEKIDEAQQQVADAGKELNTKVLAQSESWNSEISQFLDKFGISLTAEQQAQIAQVRAGTQTAPDSQAPNLKAEAPRATESAKKPELPNGQRDARSRSPRKAQDADGEKEDLILDYRVPARVFRHRPSTLPLCWSVCASARRHEGTLETRPISSPNPCAPSGVFPNPNLPFASGDASELEELVQGLPPCLSCGQNAVLGQQDFPWIRSFLSASSKDLATAVSDVLCYCPGCLCRWADRSTSTEGLPHISDCLSGPRFFPASAAQECDEQGEVSGSQKLAIVWPTCIRAFSYGPSTNRKTPVSRRARRRLNRRLRHVLEGSGPLSDPIYHGGDVLEPCAAASVHAEVVDVDSSRSQAGHDLSVPFPTPCASQSWDPSPNFDCWDATPGHCGIAGELRGRPDQDQHLLGCAAANLDAMRAPRAQEEGGRYCSGGGFFQEVVCPLGEGPGGRTFGIASLNRVSLQGPGGGYITHAEDWPSGGGVAAGRGPWREQYISLSENSNFHDHPVPACPEAGDQRYAMSHPSAAVGRVAEETLAVPNPNLISQQSAALEALKADVLAGASGPLLSKVESMESQGIISEGTFMWKAVELAVETQEDVPKHVACWALEDALANLSCQSQRPELKILSANVTSWRKALCPWIAQHQPSLCLLQETHLSPDLPDLLDSQLGPFGYAAFSLPGRRTAKGGVSGGLSICFRKHLNLRPIDEAGEAEAVNGPIAALQAYLMELGERLKRIATLEGCHDLASGIDRTVPLCSGWLFQAGMVQAATQLDTRGVATGFVYEGLWTGPHSVISDGNLVYASDASGGPGAKDPRRLINADVDDLCGKRAAQARRSPELCELMMFRIPWVTSGSKALKASFNRLMSHHCIGGGEILKEWGCSGHTQVLELSSCKNLVTAVQLSANWVKIDRAKSAYADLLDQMKSVQEELTDKQNEVAALQKAVLRALQQCGINLSSEQQALLDCNAMEVEEAKEEAVSAASFGQPPVGHSRVHKLARGLQGRGDGIKQGLPEVAMRFVLLDPYVSGEPVHRVFSAASCLSKPFSGPLASEGVRAPVTGVLRLGTGEAFAFQVPNLCLYPPFEGPNPNFLQLCGASGIQDLAMHTRLSAPSLRSLTPCAPSLFKDPRPRLHGLDASGLRSVQQEILDSRSGSPGEPSVALPNLCAASVPEDLNPNLSVRTTTTQSALREEAQLPSGVQPEAVSKGPDVDEISFALPNPCASPWPEAPNPNLTSEALQEQLRGLEADGWCIGCGQSQVLGRSTNQEVKKFVQACCHVHLNAPCDEALTALSDVLNYCPRCLCKWEAKVQTTCKQPKDPVALSGPTYFFDCAEAPEPDELADVTSMPLHVQGKIPASRRTRRRYNRRLRLEPIEPLRGAPKNPVEEVAATTDDPHASPDCPARPTKTSLWQEIENGRVALEAAFASWSCLWKGLEHKCHSEVLEAVEALESGRHIVEDTFAWRAAELAVEAGDEVPWHVAGSAVADVIANLDAAPCGRKLTFISANVTRWRKDLCPWLDRHRPDLCLVQETHITKEQGDLISTHVGPFGYKAFSLPGHPTGGGGNSGGLAVVFKKHLDVRKAHHFLHHGVGFQAVVLRIRDVDLFLVNVYLKSGEGFRSQANAKVLSHLISFLRSVRFFVAGDFNEDFSVIGTTNIDQEVRGTWLHSGASTCTGGGNIDYGILSRGLVLGAQLQVDWVTPFAPHAALHWTINRQHCDAKIPQLVGFKPLPLKPQPFVPPAAAGCDLSQPMWECELGRHWGGSLGQPALTQQFEALSGSVELSVFGVAQGRGALPKIQRATMLCHSAPAGVWGGAQAAFWKRILAWLECSKQHKCKLPLCSKLQLQLCSMWQGQKEQLAEVQAQFKKFGRDTAPDVFAFLSEAASQQFRLHSKAWMQQQSAGYFKWLKQASLKGLRGLFRSVKSEEAVHLRPFLTQPVQDRIYFRWRQWFELWSDPKGVDQALFNELKHRAMLQARELGPIPIEQAVAAFKKVPTKAPGLDGWTCEILQNLQRPAVEAIVAFLHHCELEASWPDQMVFALIALLPKSDKRERPIALLHVLYRAWVRLRWKLVADWQGQYSREAVWDKAMPGSQVLDVALSRLLRGEASRQSGQHLITIFMDMETFYDRCRFNDVISSGISLGYPPLILHQALLTYMGPRFLQSEGSVCPAITPGRGVLAGCPAAPSISKLAKRAAVNLDVWIDDMSLDAVHASAKQVATDAILLFRSLRKDLEARGATLSLEKTSFVASSPQAAKCLLEIREESDPQAIGRQKLGSLDVTFQLMSHKCEDPHLTILRQHFRAIARVFYRWQVADPDKFSSTWVCLWRRLTEAPHPWKRVTGPLSATLAYLLDLGVVAPNPSSWHHGSDALHIHWDCLDACRKVWQWLYPIWEHARNNRTSLLAGCSQLVHGIDAKVPRRLMKRRFFNKKTHVHLQTVWQGALISESKPGFCKLCNCALDLNHVLWQCPFIKSKFPEPPQFAKARELYQWPSLWLRGLVPSEATRLKYDRADTGFLVEGLWCQQQALPGDQYVFASDASGGPGAKDSRALCVSWAIAAYRLHDGVPERVASVTCLPKEPLSVAHGEQRALYELFSRTAGDFDVTVDCQGASKATASLAAVEEVKERLHSLYVEQLCERPRPEGRSGSSWDKILSTYRVAFERRLEELHTVECVWRFATKCLKKQHLREVFEAFAPEDVAENCISEELQQASLHPVEEGPNFERDLLASSAELQELLRASADCELPSSSAEPKRAFKRRLQQQDSVIELD
ncbi:unnamed protein product [Symbiodinium sp. CCMP2592]|nr:unnamed protein product [Symbiodinium sp. CCMP2592]